ncbi:MAG: phosphatase PAP2 family protein [Bacteroidota bacterium]
MKQILIGLILLFTGLVTNAITPSDSTNKHIPFKQWETQYQLKNGMRLEYERPRTLDFVAKVPKDMWGFCKYSFNKKSIPGILTIALTSAILINNDQAITDGTKSFCDHIHLARSSSYNNVFAPKLQGQHVNIISIPQNLNTALYTLGQGYPALLLGGGIFYYGLRHHDIRAVSTASQLTESFIAMGIATQVVKRITGRETPIRSTQAGGKWTPFPPFMDYQKQTPKYDAFPSGHLATVICAVTVLAENYPEKKWIKPVGYTLGALVAFSMLNNGVHWAGDYPLAFGIGYGFGKVVAASSRKIEGRKAKKSLIFSH